MDYGPHVLQSQQLSTIAEHLMINIDRSCTQAAAVTDPSASVAGGRG